MTDKEKLEKLKKLADAMYYAAQYLTTDASKLHKAMDEYHQFIIHEYHKEEPTIHDIVNEHWWEMLGEEPVSEDLEEAVNAYIGYAPEVDESSSTYGKRQAFKTGAQWQKEQFEKNRLKHCNSITNEQAELEQGFIDQHLDKYNCIPSYLDAIEYGMNLQKEQIMKDAVICAVEPRYNKEIGRYLSLGIAMNEQIYKVGDIVKLIIIKEE